MVTRLSSRFLRRSPVAWAAAWLALALNVAAPVIAYATTLARVDAAGQAAHHYDQHAGHHHGEHAALHHAGADGTTGADSAPVTPHCQYCLDFAAGAPLVLALPATPAAWEASDEHPVAHPRSAYSSAVHRFAYARGPPVSASSIA